MEGGLPARAVLIKGFATLPEQLHKGEVTVKSGMKRS
jgi:hypothetical protein